MTYKQTVKIYYQLTKPGIIYGNLLTAAAGYLFASHWHNHYLALIGMALGLALIVGCGCVINNVIDRGIDSKMERTKKRSTVTGEIPLNSAVIYGLVLGILGSLIIGFTTNTLTLFVGWFGLAIYVVIYGLAKRRTVYSTLIGSLAGAVPPLAGYTAYTNNIDLGGLLLVGILICWQLSHFYAISLYRKNDYSAAGLPVWPVVKGEWSTQLQAIAFIGLFTIFAVAEYVFGYTGYIYLIASFVIGLGWLWYAVLAARNLNAAAWGKKVFISSLSVILLICLALALGPVLP